MIETFCLAKFIRRRSSRGWRWRKRGWRWTWSRRWCWFRRRWRGW